MDQNHDSSKDERKKVKTTRSQKTETEERTVVLYVVIRQGVDSENQIVGVYKNQEDIPKEVYKDDSDLRAYRTETKTRGNKLYVGVIFTNQDEAIVYVEDWNGNSASFVNHIRNEFISDYAAAFDEQEQFTDSDIEDHAEEVIEEITAKRVYV